MKNILYLGTDPERFLKQRIDCRVIHYPVIAIVPRSLDDPHLMGAYQDLCLYTHLLFTSKNAVRIFFEHLALLRCDTNDLNNKICIAIGTSTAHSLQMHDQRVDLISLLETQEGLIEELQRLCLKDAYFLYPRSSISRPVLTTFFHEKNIRYKAFDLYETRIQHKEPLPDLNSIDEIVFTSPSTVKAFIQIFGSLPQHACLHAIGPITAAVLHSFKKTR